MENIKTETTSQTVKPGIRFEEDFRKKLLENGITEDEIKILEVYRHVLLIINFLPRTPHTLSLWINSTIYCWPWF